jgi:hypothetical protein
MYKAKQNFAYAGKTYFVSDEVPETVAKSVDPALTEKPKAKKSETFDTPEGEY